MDLGDGVSIAIGSTQTAEVCYIDGNFQYTAILLVCCTASVMVAETCELVFCRA